MTSEFGTGTGFSPSSSDLPCQYHYTVALHTHTSSGGRTIGPLVAAVQRHSLTISTWKWKAYSDGVHIFTNTCVLSCLQG
jgi:hypothetical protein